MLRPNKELCECGREKSQVAKTCFECRKKQIDRICKTCGKKYTSKQSTNKTYCSAKCRYADSENNRKMHETQSRRKKYNCRFCGKENDVQLSKHRGGFCNSECFYKYNSGENNKYWKGGITPERQKFMLSVEWKEAVKNVWKRDNATCRNCGYDFSKDRKTEMHIHHIISFKHKEYRSDVNYLILVCKNCHRFIHSNRNGEKKYIIEL